MTNCLMANCKNTFPSTQIIDGKRRNLQNRKYCFDCSPVGRHKIRSRAKNMPIHKSCDLCNKILNPKSWANRKRCNSCQVKIHRIVKKIKAINLLCGKCSDCGWQPRNIYEISAIEFHHHNDDKDYEIGRILNKKWESIISEILKCQLLCSKCHRIHHSKRDEHLEKIVDKKN